MVEIGPIDALPGEYLPKVKKKRVARPLFLAFPAVVFYANSKGRSAQIMGIPSFPKIAQIALFCHRRAT